MASLTKQKKTIAKRKERTRGKQRKRSVRAGSTPRFPIHVDKEPDAVLPQPPGSHPAER